MNHNMDAVANTNTNSDHDPDFKTFWKQLHGKELPPKTVFTLHYPPEKQIDCYSVTPKRMEYWDMAIEAGFTFHDLESMVKRRHEHVAVSPCILLSGLPGLCCRLMHIRSLSLDYGTIDQFGEEDKQVIRFVLRLVAEHPLKSSFDKGIELPQRFVEMKQLHDIPLVTNCVHLDSCDLVDCDKLMFNISQNPKYVRFGDCKLANGGADLCRWLSPNNCSVTGVSILFTRVTCDSLAKLFRSNKRINKLNISFCRLTDRQRMYSRQEIDQIIQLLSDASHLKELWVANDCKGLSRQEQDTWGDIFISLLGNKSLSSLAYCYYAEPGRTYVPPQISSTQMEALEQAMEQTTQLTCLRISPSLPNKHDHWYHALVERILRRNHRNKVRAVLCSLPTWSRPLALFGEVLMRISKRQSRLDPMGSTNETFHILLQCSDMLKQTWDDRRADRQRPDTTEEIAPQR